MKSKKVNEIVQESCGILSKPHWREALRLAREELCQVEDRAKILRESISTFERLVSPIEQQHRI